MSLKTYRLPPVFWWDHHQRDLPEEGHSQLQNETSSSVEVEMDTAAYDDLLSDASHYAYTNDYSLGLRSSARATLAALERQGRP